MFCNGFRYIVLVILYYTHYTLDTLNNLTVAYLSDPVGQDELPIIVQGKRGGSEGRGGRAGSYVKANSDVPGLG